MYLNKEELTGQARTHVPQFSTPRFAAQKEVGEAFLAMREAAAKAGFDLVPFSSFRDFKTQLRIWNKKFSGAKPLYDINGQVRNYHALTDEEIIDCILNWSALPGGSRHQWGTEIDVVDGAVMPNGYQPKLLPEEVAPNGLFYDLHLWLNDNIEQFGFFRPYATYLGGMYPEPWHLSYRSLADEALAQVTPDLLIDILKNTDILGKELLLDKIPEIYENHLLAICR